MNNNKTNTSSRRLLETLRALGPVLHEVAPIILRQIMLQEMYEEIEKNFANMKRAPGHAKDVGTLHAVTLVVFVGDMDGNPTSLNLKEEEKGRLTNALKKTKGYREIGRDSRRITFHHDVPVEARDVWMYNRATIAISKYHYPAYELNQTTEEALNAIRRYESHMTAETRFDKTKELEPEAYKAMLTDIIDALWSSGVLKATDRFHVSPELSVCDIILNDELVSIIESTGMEFSFVKGLYETLRWTEKEKALDDEQFVPTTLELHRYNEEPGKTFMRKCKDAKFVYELFERIKAGAMRHEYEQLPFKHKKSIANHRMEYARYREKCLAEELPPTEF